MRFWWRWRKVARKSRRRIGFPDAEWARIEPVISRGRRGAHRADDRRVIGGIVFDDRFRRVCVTA
jgi:transposase